MAKIDEYSAETRTTDRPKNVTVHRKQLTGDSAGIKNVSLKSESGFSRRNVLYVLLKILLWKVALSLSSRSSRSFQDLGNATRGWRSLKDERLEPKSRLRYL